MYFFRKYKDRMIVTAVAVILIIIIGITSRERLSVSKFENILGSIFRPIKNISFTIGNKVSASFSSVANITKLSKENKELKLEISKLREENMDLENIIGKSDFLRSEAELLAKTGHNLVSAQVTGKEPGNWYSTFTINKGLKSGIEKGDTIIQGIELEKGNVHEGIVGRVVDVADSWAKVVSIIDDLNKVAFKIVRTQDGGILSGSISNSMDNVLEGYLYDSNADVIVGDKLYTSGLGGAFVKDLYIGEVERVIEVEEELMKKIVVKPAIDFKKLYKVFAIIE